ILVFSPKACSPPMIRRAVLAGSPATGSVTGYNANHAVLERLLDKARVPGWTKATVVEGGEGSRAHSRKVAGAATDVKADLLHITNQHHAHLVPRASDVPVVVSVHDLFDFRPRSMEAGDVAVPLGDRNPSTTRAEEIHGTRVGMGRADLLLCASEMTLADAESLFPDTRAVVVRDSIDEEHWDPIANQRPRELLGGHDEEGKCLIVSVGGQDPRWRNQFVSRVMGMIPEEVSRDIHLIRIGVEMLDREQIAAAYQNAEAMLYPGVSVGFHCPPAEAMAAGCPVLASDLPTHDELLPADCLLPATDPDAWVSEIVAIHSDWRRAGGVLRHVDERLVAHAASTSGRNAHGEVLGRAYDSCFADN
ncbi:MAG: glycosyltransferase family 4 protein, partial [Candidatus Thalassarchaeaceae archaeon]|nr:glycosyltransferase family 4 protein [Candidatus Thalassarchaeaceae archaeon]